MRPRFWLIVSFVMSLVLATRAIHAQQVRLPGNNLTDAALQGSVTNNPLAPVPRPGASTGVPSTTLGQPSFDPYSTAPNAASTPPSLLPQTGTPNSGAAASPFWGAPAYPQNTAPPASGVPAYPAPNAYGPGAHPTQPGILFPDGINMPYFSFPKAQPGPYMRLFQDVRMNYTWVAGSDGPDKMTTNDVEVATTMNWPNFLFSGQPIHVSPAFIFHFWDGPDRDPVRFPTDLPSRVYSTYLSSRWQPQLTPAFGGDIEFNIGVYTDYNTFRTDSVRFTGTGLLVLAVTPTVALKGGVTYLDRVDLKLLPAAGILWTPNPQTRFDIYFPKPKLAQYLTTIGNTDVWWYINGEIGGGSWTITRPLMGGDNRVDINDYRIGGGLEWTSQLGLKAYVEAAYVFHRELVFATGPPTTHELKDSIMVRGGIAY